MGVLRTCRIGLGDSRKGKERCEDKGGKVAAASWASADGLVGAGDGSS